MLFEASSLRATKLSNRIVMSPLTRSRASDNNTANGLMATYYAQRATAGLIITEGTSPSPNGLGYARIPGLFNDAHVQGWKLVTDAVHSRGGRINPPPWVQHRSIIPFIEVQQRVDIRTKTVDLEQQETITKDSVTIKVNAVLWFRILNPEGAIIRVADYNKAVYQFSVTALRNIIGQHTLDEVLREREQIDRILQ